jgi:hypothetical protein
MVVYFCPDYIVYLLYYWCNKYTHFRAQCCLELIVEKSLRQMESSNRDPASNGLLQPGSCVKWSPPTGITQLHQMCDWIKLPPNGEEMLTLLVAVILGHILAVILLSHF